MEASPADKGARGSTSPGLDYALILPLIKALGNTTTSKKRPSSNAREKTIAKEMTVGSDNEDLVEANTTLIVPPSKKINNNNIVFTNMKYAASLKRVANLYSFNIIFACMQNTHPNVVTTTC